MVIDSMRAEIYPIFNTVSEFTFTKILMWSPHSMDMTYYGCLGSFSKREENFYFCDKVLKTLVKALLFISYSLLSRPLNLNLGLMYLFLFLFLFF